MSGYYQRDNVVHLDGTRVFAKPEDVAAEFAVARVVEAAWQCQLARFGALAPVDWYAARFGRLIGVLELKSRSHDFGTYSTVFLNVRKWLALSLASVGLGVPAVFVVKFTDRICWSPVKNIDAARVRIGGCTGFVKATSDVEPVIDIPISILRVLPTGSG